MPFRDPGRLLEVTQASTAAAAGPVSGSTFDTWQRSALAAELAAMRPINLTISRGGGSCGSSSSRARSSAWRACRAALPIDAGVVAAEADALAPVAVVNQRMAGQMWPRQDAAASSRSC